LRGTRVGIDVIFMQRVNQAVSCRMNTPQRSPLTIGVEEEFQLLCPDTLALLPGFGPLSECWNSRPSAGSANLKSELHQSCCEVTTRPCANVGELDNALRVNRMHLAETAARAGLTVGLSGMHPFSRWDELPITREPRRLQSEYLFQEAHRQCLAFALHVHIGIPDRHVGLRVVNDARVLLPVLYALSCSSPFLESRRSGLKSSRLLRAFGFPRTGIPDAVGSLAELDGQVAVMRKAGLIADPGQLWWDIRLHHVYPTVEFRIADAVPRVEDVTALAALTQALVGYLLDAYRNGGEFALVPRWLLCENRWRAARFGTEAELIAGTPCLPTCPTNVPVNRWVDPAAPLHHAGNMALRSIESIVDELLATLAPVADKLESLEYLERCRTIAGSGSAADRQLAAATAGQPGPADLQEVVRLFRRETLDI